MKKIFTLLFAIGMVAVAQAQSGSRDNRQFDQRNDQRNDQQYDQRKDQQYDQRTPGQNDQRIFNDGYDNGKITFDANFSFGNDRGFGNSRSFNERKRDMQIARINQVFDYKVQMVKRSFYMSWWEKQSQIRSLEQQRQWEIRMLYVKFNDRNRYGNPYDHNRDYNPYDHNRGYDRNDYPDRQF